MNKSVSTLQIVISIAVIIIIFIFTILNIVDQSLGLSLGVVTGLANFFLLLFERSEGFYTVMRLINRRESGVYHSKFSQREKKTGLSPQQYLKEKIRGFEDSQRNSFIPPSYSTNSAAVSKVRHEQSFSTLTDMYNRFNQFILVGYPGVGKTVVMKELFKEIATRHLKEEGEKDQPPLPLWIDLNEISNPIDTDELFSYWFEIIYDLPVGFEQTLHTRPPVIFLDGLNEMPLITRSERAKSLRKWLSDHQEVKVIISCRTRDYEDDPVLNMGKYMPVVRVESFERDQIFAFLKHVVPKQVRGLMRRIDEDDALFRLSQIPLHLSMFAVLSDIYGYRQLPNRLLDLYDKYLEQRYIRESEEKGMMNHLWEDIVKRLRKLAYQMDGSLSLPTRFVRRSLGKKALSDAFNLNLLMRSRDAEGKGLSLMSSSYDTIRFYHQSLHGYFALPQLLRDIKRIEFLTNLTILPSFLVSLITPRNPSAIIRQIGDLGDTAEIAVDTLADLLGSQNQEIATASRSALIDIGVSSINAMLDILDDKLVELEIQDNGLMELEELIAKQKMITDKLKQSKRIADKQNVEKKKRNKINDRFDEENKKLKDFNSQLTTLQRENERDRESDSLLKNTKAVLSGIGSTAIAPMLLWAFKKASPTADEQISEILQIMELNQRPDVPLINAVKQRSKQLEEFKLHLSDELGKVGSSRAVEPLLPLLADEDWEVRTEVIVALLKINRRIDIASIIIDPVVEALKTETQRLPQNYIVQLLIDLSPNSITALIREIGESKGNKRKALEQGLFIMIDRNVEFFELIRTGLKKKSNYVAIVKRIANYLQNKY